MNKIYPSAADALKGVGSLAPKFDDQKAVYEDLNKDAAMYLIIIPSKDNIIIIQNFR